MDQEPLNETKFPKMCRIFRNSEQEEIFFEDKNTAIIDKSIYLELLGTCLKYIDQKVL